MTPSEPTRDAFEVLAETSRTFMIPIARLPPPLREAVASSYLCMRAIDEIEDHPALPHAERARLLRSIELAMQDDLAVFDARDPTAGASFAAALAGGNGSEGEHGSPRALPEVTQRLGEWLQLAPADIRPRVADAIGAMAGRMGHWASVGFAIRGERDLDRYTYAVAGAVGVLLGDLWAWHDGTRVDRRDGVAFGRGLQAVNILRNRAEDLAKGVDFYPQGWDDAALARYARRHLVAAERYTAALPAGPIREFCAIPLALAHATLTAREAGRTKLSRPEVAAVVKAALRES